MSSVNSDDEQQQRWVPTHVQVTVLRARGLRGKGKNGTSDVYTIIQVGKEKYSTCVVERSTSPEWKEECSFELLPGVLEEGGRGAYPPGSCDLVLTVMHRALIGLDVFLGQAVIPLDKAFQDHVYATNEAEWVNLRSRWFRLNSKTGKKEKERGEVQATVQFTRNNLTASMYHLAMKDKSHSAFSKLKERMRGKKRTSVDEDAPAAAPPAGGGGGGGGVGSLPRSRSRLPSDGGGEEEYEDDEGGEGRRNKMRTFFLRGKLRKSSETRSSTSLGSESSESSSRGGSLSPTAGISVVVSDLSNSPSTSSNLTADNSPEHTADISPKLSPDHSEFGDECREISIAVPSLYHNGVHPPHRGPPLRPGPGDPAAAAPTVSLAPAAPAAPTAAAPAKASALGLGLLLKPLPTSLSLQNLSPREEEPPRTAGGAGDGRRWSFDKPGEEEKAAIAAALEKSGPMVGDDEEEEEEAPAPAVSAGAARGSYDRKQQQQQKKKVSGGRAGSEPAQERTGKGWFGSKDCNNKPSPVVSAKLGRIPESPHPPPPVLPQSRHPPWGPRAPPAPPSPPPPVPASPLHHTNPFWHSQGGPPPPPPMSPRNPFFSSPQHHPAPAVALSGLPLTPRPPPLPHLSSSRPPVAQLFPGGAQPSPGLPQGRPAPEGRAVSASDATGGSVVPPEPRHRPLPPFPAERPLSRRSPNPFVSSRTSELDVDWDDSFEAFASCRLQSAEDASARSKPQEPQKGPAQNSPKSQLLALWHPDEEEQLQTTEAAKDPGCSDTFQSATNQQAGMLLTAPLEDTHTNLANYSSDVLTCTTPPLALFHHYQCAHSPSISCDVEELKDSRYSSDPSSSGVGSLAEEDVLSIISSCSASEKLSACVGKDVEAKGVHGSPLNVCEESPEQTVVGVLGDSEEKLCDWLGPLVVDHTVEGDLIQISDQNEKPQSMVLMDDDRWLVSLPVVSLVEIQCRDGPSKGPCPTHVPRSDLSSNNPNTSVPSDQELEPSACKTEKMEEACELQESFGDLHKPDNISVQATNVVEETFTPDILDSRETSLCPSFHTVTSFLGDESSLLETPLGAGALGEQLVHQSSPKSPSPLWSSQMMAAPILVFNESSLMETPLGVRHSSPEPSELLDVDASQTLTVPVAVFDTALPGETWSGPGPGGLLSCLYGSTDSQHYQTCLTHNSSAATTVLVDSLVEPPSGNLVLSPENAPALGLEGSTGGRGPWDVSREPGAEWLPSKVLLSEDFGFQSVLSRHHGNKDGPTGGAQESEGPPSEDTSPARAPTTCPALQRSHSEGALGTGSSGCSLTSYGSHPSVVHPLPPNDPARPPLPSLCPTSCLPAEAPSARYALPNALLPPPPGPAPQAPPPAPRAATPAREEACSATGASSEPHVAARPEAPREEGPPDSPHPVRPLTPGGPQGSEGRSVLEKLRATMQPGRSCQLSEEQPERRKSLTEGAGSYFHLTHNELVALLVRREAELERQKAEFERQTALLSRREVELRKLKPQVRDLENYIDTLLVQIMEQTPTLLQVRSKFK